MKILLQLFNYVKAIYSVIFDQKWYWMHLRPKLEGSKGWVELVKTSLIVWLFSLTITTVLLIFCSLLAINQNRVSVYINTTESFIVIVFFSTTFGIGSKSKLLWSIPAVVTLGTISGFTPLFTFILTSPGIDLNLVMVVSLAMTFVLGGCFGIIFLVARGEGVTEMLLGMIKSGWRAAPESKAWSIFTGVTVTGLVALMIVPLVGVMLYIGWEEGIGIQVLLVLLAMFLGLYLGEIWASRQISSVTERKRLANCRE
jgi:hypothetical protein